MTNYQIFQVKAIPELRNYLFMNLSFLKKEGLEVERKNYKMVYEGKIEVGKEDWHTLENLFHKFNMQHPEDYTSRSMSVSDVVKLEDEYYYCDSFGFKKLENF